MIIMSLLLAALSAPPAQVGVRIQRSRTIIRVPRQAEREPTRWREERGPRCIAANRLAGASVNGNESVDLILRGGGRIRADLERRCPAMDFYSGFYVRPNSDGMICADRDDIRSRSGGRCGIERFRRLVPERARGRR